MFVSWITAIDVFLVVFSLAVATWREIINSAATFALVVQTAVSVGLQLLSNFFKRDILFHRSSFLRSTRAVQLYGQPDNRKRGYLRGCA